MLRFGISLVALVAFVALLRWMVRRGDAKTVDEFTESGRARAWRKTQERWTGFRCSVAVLLCGAFVPFVVDELVRTELSQVVTVSVYVATVGSILGFVFLVEAIRAPIDQREEARALGVPGEPQFDLSVRVSNRVVTAEVFNEGPEGQFMAQIVKVRGLRFPDDVEPFLPWPVRWFHHAGAKEVAIPQSEKEILHLGDFDGWGVRFYTAEENVWAIAPSSPGEEAQLNQFDQTWGPERVAPQTVSVVLRVTHLSPRISREWPIAFRLVSSGWPTATIQPQSFLKLFVGSRTVSY